MENLFNEDNYIIEGLCANCEKRIGVFMFTVYGGLLCEDCAEQYLDTEDGHVEYILGIVEGEYSINDFSPDFLGHCVVQWNANKHMFALSEDEINRIEKDAKTLGIF